MSSSSRDLQGQPLWILKLPVTGDNVTGAVLVNQRIPFPRGWRGGDWGQRELPAPIPDIPIPRGWSPPTDGLSLDQSCLSLLIYKVGLWYLPHRIIMRIRRPDEMLHVKPPTNSEVGISSYHAALYSHGTQYAWHSVDARYLLHACSVGPDSLQPHGL